MIGLSLKWLNDVACAKFALSGEINLLVISCTYWLHDASNLLQQL